MNSTMIRMLLSLALAAALVSASALAGERQLEAEFVVNASLDEAWTAWTTNEGLQSFFAPHCRIDPRVKGQMDIWFSPDAPAGQRGAEGEVVVQFIEKRRLAFTWAFPPNIPTLRIQRTLVTLDFQALDENRTRIRFAQIGWGRGDDWNKGFDYFDEAWNKFVLPRFKHAVEVGPIESGARPDLAPIADTLKSTTE
ncbi:MAG TPA: SRPBCC domain-containing protein [Acidobacteriota bacterium]|nr:SRPBCC domain-containing protein [Acidobacteriota bacterium]